MTATQLKFTLQEAIKPHRRIRDTRLLPVISALGGGGWSTQPSGRFTRCPLYRACQDGCGRSRPHRDSIPGPCRPQRVVIPTELTWPTTTELTVNTVFHKTIYAATDFQSPQHYCYLQHVGRRYCDLLRTLHVHNASPPDNTQNAKISEGLYHPEMCYQSLRSRSYNIVLPNV